MNGPKEWDAEKIKALRKKYRMNQEVLARIVGMRGQQAISDWETEVHKPSRVCRILLDKAEETLFFIFEREAKKDFTALNKILLHRYGAETKLVPKL